MVDTDEVFRSLPHVLNQASQDHFSPFLQRQMDPVKIHSLMTIAQTTETLYFNHSIAVKGPAIHTPLYYKISHDHQHLRKKKNICACCLLKKVKGTVHKIEI